MVFAQIVRHTSFQLTAARRRLAAHVEAALQGRSVSTHSRPKAAGGRRCAACDTQQRFNSQPPEGGWIGQLKHRIVQDKFQLTAARRRLEMVFAQIVRHPPFQLTAARRRLDAERMKPEVVAVFQLTAARRRLGVCGIHAHIQRDVSTHSRPKAAGMSKIPPNNPTQGFNSQPPEGGWMSDQERLRGDAVSTHSRPKAAGSCGVLDNLILFVSTHSRPKAAGRRNKCGCGRNRVSTHSRPKAAGIHQVHPFAGKPVSTHSRPKAAGASAETLGPQGLHCPVSLRFH